jgi:hypothetical protein
MKHICDNGYLDVKGCYKNEELRIADKFGSDIKKSLASNHITFKLQTWMRQISKKN